MRSVLIATTLAAVAGLQTHDSFTKVVKGGKTVIDFDSVISAVNGPESNSTWVADLNSKFDGMSLSQIKAMMGTIRDAERVAAVKARLSPYTGTTIAVPASFDVRTAWPYAANITGHIRDQSACGSCWAFGSTESFNDRLAINNNFTRFISTADTFECCQDQSMGCDGGFPDDAWNWFTTTGAVTGGDYGDAPTATCSNYPFAQCSHHEPGHYPDCPSSDYNTPSCRNKCQNAGYATPYAKDKQFAKTAYNLNSVADAQSDIAQYGSISATFDVYTDFLTYKSGVYSYQTGSLLGGHAVRIIGWGTEGGQDYWLVANSWNQYWGDNGTFKILRGTDECGIEDDLGAGTV